MVLRICIIAHSNATVFHTGVPQAGRSPPAFIVQAKEGFVTLHSTNREEIRVNRVVP
jgi:hypothetical protein